MSKNDDWIYADTLARSSASNYRTILCIACQRGRRAMRRGLKAYLCIHAGLVGTVCAQEDVREDSSKSGSEVAGVVPAFQQRSHQT